jgi:hypothetical protein
MVQSTKATGFYVHFVRVLLCVFVCVCERERVCVLSAYSAYSSACV